MASTLRLPFLITFIEHIRRDGALSRYVHYTEEELNDLERACQIGLVKGEVDSTATPARFRFESLRPAADHLLEVLQNTPLRDAVLEKYPVYAGDTLDEIFEFAETWKKAKRDSRLSAHPSHLSD